MFTCGLVRSNLALATGSSSGLVCRHPDGFRMRCELVCIYFSWLGATSLRSLHPVGELELVPLVLLDDLLCIRLGDLRVAVERHRVDGATRGLRAQVSDVSEHL